MRRSHLLEHLSVAKSLAEAEGESFTVYLIKMALDAAKASKSDNQPGSQRLSA